MIDPLEIGHYNAGSPIYFPRSKERGLIEGSNGHADDDAPAMLSAFKRTRPH